MANSSALVEEGCLVVVVENLSSVCSYQKAPAIHCVLVSVLLDELLIEPSVYMCNRSFGCTDVYLEMLFSMSESSILMS